MLDALTVVVGDGRDLLVEVIVTAPVDAQLYMPRPSNSNTTVFDITRLSNSAGKYESLLSLHIMTGYDTKLVLQPRESYNS